MAIELAYINTKHPDFTEATLIHKSMTETMETELKKMQQRNPPNEGPNRQLLDDTVSTGV